MPLYFIKCLNINDTLELNIIREGAVGSKVWLKPSETIRVDTEVLIPRGVETVLLSLEDDPYSSAVTLTQHYFDYTVNISSCAGTHRGYI